MIALRPFADSPTFLKEIRLPAIFSSMLYGQMLFDPQFEDSVGLCSEYTIHWNASFDSCNQLSEKSSAFSGLNGYRKPIRDCL